jgi:hypothetical protein
VTHEEVAAYAHRIIRLRYDWSDISK